MATKRTAPLSPPSSVVGALNDFPEPSKDVPSSTGPTTFDAGAPPPGRDPTYSVEEPEPPPVRESRIIRPETLTRKYDEAERRIRRQVSQHIERGVRIIPPVNISALEHGGYTTTSGSRVGFDLKRFSGQNWQGGELGRSEGNTTSRGGGNAPTVNTQVSRRGGPVDATGRDLLDRYTDVPGLDDVRRGVAGGRSRTNPRGLLSAAERMSRGRAF